MKEFFKKLWEKIKAWGKLTALPWLKKSWMQIINILIVFMAYGRLFNLEEGGAVTTLVGLWLFILLGYYIFWKLLGLEKVFIKKKEPVKPIIVVPDEPVVPVEPVEPPEPVKPVDPIPEDNKEEILPKATVKKRATSAKKKPATKKPVKKTATKKPVKK